MKLKQKNHFRVFVKIFIFFPIFLLGFFLFVPELKVFAKTIPAKDIKYEISVFDNFYRTKKDGEVSFDVKIKLLSPDNIDFSYDPTAADAVLRGDAGDRINALAVGVVAKSQNNSKCQEVTSLFGGLIGSKIYYCDFSAVSSGWPGFSTAFLGTETWNKGEEKTFQVKLNASNFRSMDFKDSTKGEINEIYVYPYFSLFGISNNTSFSPAKSVYLQVFSDQASLDAGKLLPRPPEVPANGSLESSPNQNPGGSGIAALVNSIVALILGIVQEIIYFFFFYIIAPLVQAMLSIHVYTDAFVAVIYPGWEVVRNLTNIIFIVALIAIAMATLLRVESYQYKSLLVQLILGALLVNFSLVIAQAILGVADTVQAQFLPNNVEVIRSLGKDLMVSWRQSAFTGFGDFSTVVRPFFQVSLSLGSFLVFLALCAFLVIRMVMLWVLLMVSPIAYAAGVLPATKQYRGQWWGNFLKYAFFTPIIAFFLNMAAVISNTLYKNLGIYGDLGINAQDLGGSGVAEFVLKIATNILLLVFLLVAIKVAEQFGIYGAQGISNFVKKGTFLPFKAAKAGAERAFEGLQNATGVTMDPRIWAEQWKKYSEAEKHKRLDKRADKPIGIGSWRIDGSQKYGLGSPLDFYKNFVNGQAVKRIGKNLIKSEKKAFGDLKDAEKEFADLKKQGSVMSQGDFNDAVKKRDESTAAFEKLVSSVKKSMEEKAGLEKQLEEMKNRYKSATSEDEKSNIKRDMEIVKEELEKAKAKLVKTGTLEQDDDGNFIEEDGKLVLSDSNQDTSELSKAQLLKGQFEQKVKDDENKLEEAIKANPGFARFSTEAEKEKHKEALNTARDKFMAARKDYAGRQLPKAYHARAARQSLESEEEKKVSEIKNWPEKVQVFLSAQAENNPYLAAAAVKSLAKDSNVNEILEAMGYDTSAEGMKQFFENEYKKKFNLTDHQMMEVATEVGYINEDSGWWNIARISAIDNHGHLTWAVDTDLNGEWAKIVEEKNGVNLHSMGHEAAIELLMNTSTESTAEYNAKWAPQNGEIKVEMEKRGPRVIANFARTSFVNQTLGPDGGHVTTGIHKAGKEIMQTMSRDQNTGYEFGRMLRPNTAKAIAAAPEWSWEYCKENGISRDIYKKINSLADKPIEG